MGRPRKSPSMTDGKREIISRLIEEYDIKTAEDIQDALRDLLGGTIQGMMECEMEAQKEKRHPILNINVSPLLSVDLENFGKFFLSLRLRLIVCRHDVIVVVTNPVHKHMPNTVHRT